MTLRQAAAVNRKGVTSLSQLRGILALGEEGPMSKTDFSDRCGVTPGGGTTVIDALEAEGLVVVSRHPEDRRSQIVRLSHAGEEMFNLIAIADKP